MDETADLQERIQSIINKHDPLKLIKSGAPAAEYAPETERIVFRLASARSAEQLHDVVYDVFVEMFDARIAGEKEKYRAMSEEIYALRSVYSKRTVPRRRS